jgi:Uma2 family endonuclease
MGESQPRIDALTPAQAAGFWPLCPDVAIEVKSDTERSRAPAHQL